MQPASRGWRPEPATERRRGGSLRTPAMRTLTVALLGFGVLLGADEVAVTAAAKALEGSTAAAAPLLALWGAGSFAGGLLVDPLRRRRAHRVGLVLWLVALTVGHLALIPAAGELLALGAVLLIAGATIAPTESTVYAMVEGRPRRARRPRRSPGWPRRWQSAAPSERPVAGVLADSAGRRPHSRSVARGALAVLTTALRSHTLDPRKASALGRRTGGPPTVTHDMPEPIRQTGGELCL